jgi:hypothetical protein
MKQNPKPFVLGGAVTRMTLSFNGSASEINWKLKLSSEEFEDVPCEERDITFQSCTYQPTSKQIGVPVQASAIFSERGNALEKVNCTPDFQCKQHLLFEYSEPRM